MREARFRNRFGFGATSRVLIFLFLSFLWATTALALFTPFEATIAKFDAEVAAGVTQDAAGCVSVAVFEGGKVIWSKGYGWADIENRVPATADTIGRIGLTLREANGVKYAGHGGSVAGYNADLLFEPQSQLGVAILRTTSYNPPTARFLEELVTAGAK